MKDSKFAKANLYGKAKRLFTEKASDTEIANAIMGNSSHSNAVVLIADTVLNTVAPKKATPSTPTKEDQGYKASRTGSNERQHRW